MRILLVEDDPMIGAAVHAALKDAAYAADWVRNGQTALTTLGAQHYDLVLLDLGLPGKDGMEVLRTLRATPRTKELPVIIVTAKDTDRAVLEGFQSGANYYITKPFEPRELVDSVELIMGFKLEA